MPFEILDEIIYIFLSLFDQPRFFSFVFKNFLLIRSFTRMRCFVCVTFGPCLHTRKGQNEKKDPFFAHAHYLCPILYVLGSESV